MVIIVIVLGVHFKTAAADAEAMPMESQEPARVVRLFGLCVVEAVFLGRLLWPVVLSSFPK